MVRIRLECASEGLFLVRKELALALARLKPCRFAGLWAEAPGQPPAGPTGGCSPLGVW